MSSMVSIIVPAYNVEPYIEKCITTLLNQTYKNIEIIVVNDGSTDHTFKVLKELEQQYDKVKVVTQKNAGLSEARNTGIRYATGEYLNFVDPDDWVGEQYIELLTFAIKETGSDISVIGMKETFDDNIVFSDDGTIKKYSNEDALKKMFFQNEFDVGAMAKLFKANLFKHAQFKSGILYEDFDLIPRLFLSAKNGVAFNSSIQYAYLQRKNSIMSQKFTNKSLEMLEVIESNKKLFSENTDVYLALCSKSSSALNGILRKSVRDHADNQIQNKIYYQLKSNVRQVGLFVPAPRKIKVMRILTFFGKNIYLKILKYT